MSLLARMSYHSRYLSYAAGRRTRFGRHCFRMHGYFPNKFYSGRPFEPYLDSLIAAILGDRRGAFIDVGTNVGQTLAKVLAIDPHRQYIGFEPQISCAFYVDEFLQENGIETAQVIPVALWERSKFVTLHMDAEVDEAASMADWSPRARSSARKRVLSAVRGDDAIEGLAIDRIAAIKVDVEGAELFVMRGLENSTLRPPLGEQLAIEALRLGRQAGAADSHPPELAASLEGRHRTVLLGGVSRGAAPVLSQNCPKRAREPPFRKQQRSRKIPRSLFRRRF